MKKFTLCLKIGVCFGLCLVLISFSSYRSEEDDTVYVQQKLTDHYNNEPEGSNIKKFELSITSSGFCRYKRFFKNGMIEYFSFSLNKFSQLDYSGTVGSGKLYLRTKGDDVIVQTYNTKKGDDIDSMATAMIIPLKNIEAEELNELQEKFLLLSQKLRK